MGGEAEEGGLDQHPLFTGPTLTGPLWSVPPNLKNLQLGAWTPALRRLSPYVSSGLGWLTSGCL